MGGRRFCSAFGNLLGSGGSGDTAGRFTEEVVTPKNRATSAPESPIFFRAIRQRSFQARTTAPVLSPRVGSPKLRCGLSNGSRTGEGCQGHSERGGGTGCRHQWSSARPGHRDPAGLPSPNHQRIRLHHRSAQNLAYEELKNSSKEIRQLPLERCPVPFLKAWGGKGSGTPEPPTPPRIAWRSGDGRTAERPLPLQQGARGANCSSVGSAQQYQGSLIMGMGV